MVAAVGHEDLSEWGAAVDKITAWFDQLDDAEQIIIRDHVCAADPAPLDTLASELHTFRHVVHRRRNDLPQSLQNVIEDDVNLQHAVAGVEREIACPVIETDLISRHPWLANEVTDGITALDVLGGLKWPGSQVDGWVFDGDIEREERRTRAALGIEVGETMTLTTAQRLLQHAGVRVAPGESTLCRWLARCGLTVSARQIALLLRPLPEDDTEGTTLAVTASPQGPETVPASVTMPPGRSDRREQTGRDPAQPGTAHTVALGTSMEQPTGVDVLWSRLDRLRTLAVEHQVTADLGTLLLDADHLPADLHALASQIRGAFVGSDGQWSIEQADPESSSSDVNATTGLAIPAPDAGAATLLPRTGEEAQEPKDLAAPQRASRDQLPASDTDGRADLRAGRMVLTAVEVALAASEQPMSTLDVLNSCAHTMDATQLEQALAADSRFRRIAGDRWVLAEWDVSMLQRPTELVASPADENRGAAPCDEAAGALMRQSAADEADVRQVTASPLGPDASRHLAAELTSPSPRRWLDAFPWLASGAPEVQAWWNDIITDASPSLRQQHLSQVTDYAMTRLSQWTMGQIFPRLAPDLVLNRLDLPTRAMTAFGQRRYYQVGDLAGITLEEMRAWRYVGDGTVVAILGGLAEASTVFAVSVQMAGHHVVPSATQQQLPQSQWPQWTLDIVQDASKIATWYATVGLPEQPLLNAPLPGTPQDVLQTYGRLEALKAKDLLSTDQLELDVAGLLDQALRTLERRSAEILTARCFRDDSPTLDQIGKDYGVTRERVRQIEGKARTAMRGLLGEGLLGQVAETIRTLSGTVRPLDDLLTLLPALGKVVDVAGQPAWRVLSGLDDAYEINGEWCAALTIAAARTNTQTQLHEKSDAYGVVRLDDLDLIETLRSERLSQLTESWLTQCGYVTDGGFVFIRTQSVNDYGAAVLSIEGAPLTAQEIVDRFIFERNIGSLRNALSQDDRFQRVDRDRWALSEWDMDAYAGVRSLIQEQVERGGGGVVLNDLIEYITGKYSVTAASVVTYASSLPFENRDGVVRMAAADREIRKSPERTRRLFRHQDAWAYRVRITKDHLRGSGFPAPVAIAGIAELQFGQTRQLASRLGPQAVSWTGNQPAFGSVRRFLIDSDIAVDTEVFLIMTDDGRFALEPVREPTGDALADALSLIGVPDTPVTDEARQALTNAIGISPRSPITSVIGGYSERGDNDISSLLIAIRDVLETNDCSQPTASRADIDEIMDLL
ncbi:sigma factor-like helix-turn-helix DNA-binding protein [Streptomyces chartreusis]|uniref:sigma factor-like helix-turn-helix DNA-binding protein n=1 Tax=Streptomyces chartreusis TaxID=1969 RepID=UPI003657A8E7